MHKPQGSKRGRGAPPGSANARVHGFYSNHFTEAELTRIAAYIADPTLDDEIFMLRTINARLLANLNEATDEQLRQALEAFTRSTGRIAGLLRDKRALSGQAADSLTGAVATILDELGEAWGRAL